MKNYNTKCIFVITLTESHLHYCKALVSSVVFFHPNYQILIIKDGRFSTVCFEKFDNIEILTSADINKYHSYDLNGLLTKINIVFLPLLGYNYKYYIHLDADSILTNPLDFEKYDEDFDFSILQGEVFDCKNQNQMEIMNNYAFNPNEFNEYNFDKNKLYYFSSSHIIFNKDIFCHIEPLISKHRYEMNKDFSKDKRFKFGDQGFLNFAVNELYYRNLIKVKVDNCAIFGYEDKINYPLLTLENVSNNKNTTISIIHYTNSSRKTKIINHNYGDILDFFLKLHYKNKFVYLLNENLRILKYYKKRILKKIKYKILHIKNKLNLY